MKKRFTRKTWIEFILILVTCLILLYVDISRITHELTLDMMNHLSELEKTIDEVEDRNGKSDENIVTLHKHFAKTAAYYLKNSGKPLNEETLAHLTDIMNARGVFVIDPTGRILLSDNRVKFDSFSDADSSALLKVSEDHPVSEMVTRLIDDESLSNDPFTEDETEDKGTGFLPYEVDDTLNNRENGHIDSRGLDNSKEIFESDHIENIKEADSIASLISCYMDSGHILVLCDSYIDYSMDFLVRQNVANIMTDQRYGQHGFYFTVFNDGSYSVYPNSPMYQGKVIDSALPRSCQKDGYSGIISLNGTRYFCTVKQTTGFAKFLVCALPLKELTFAIIFLSLPILALVVISLLLMSFYTYALSSKPHKKKKNENNRGAKRKLFILTSLCACFTMLVSIYNYTLYTYSFVVSSDILLDKSLQKKFDSSEETKAIGSINYNNAMFVFSRAAEALISEEPSFRENARLVELAGELGAEHILVYDLSGTVTASDMNYNGLKLSDDPKALSNEFWWVIRGEPILIQSEVDDVYLNTPYRFSGIPLRDDHGQYQGMVQLAFEPALRDNMVVSTSPKSILSSFKDSKDTFSLAIEDDTGIIHSSTDEYNGLTVKEMGLSDDILKDEFSGFRRIQNQNMFVCSDKGGDYWVLVLSHTGRIPLEAAHRGFLAALPCVLAMFLFFFFLIMIDNPDDDVLWKKSRKFFKNKRLEAEKADHYILYLLHLVAIIWSMLITLIVFSGTSLFEEGTIGYYMFVYPWSKGIHIFTINRCLTFLCVLFFVMSLLIYVLTLLSSLLSSRQETVVRLVLSFAKYVGWVVAACFCLNLFGMPMGSLVASAGLVTAVFSIGAQSIVADILTGLFIIFEGSFKVGDMITVDDWHGQVMEIGIRNTTIRDLKSSDVKIMNNSTIKKVINFSEFPSLCPVSIGIEYGTDLKSLEEIIKREIPVIKDNMPVDIGVLRYTGVEEFSDSAMMVRFEAACRNQEFWKVKWSLNREVKLMFDRNGISVPFPQVVVHDARDEEE